MGKHQVRTYVKMYHEVVDGGLIRELSSRLFRGLCCVARYANNEGVLWPSGARIASDLGITRQHAQKLLADLCTFRRENGQPVLTLEQKGGLGGGGRKFRSNVYRLHPLSGLQFGNFVQPNGGREGRADSVPPKGGTVDEIPCHPLEPVPCNPRGGSNKSYRNKNTHTVCVDSGGEKVLARELVLEFHRAFGRAVDGREPAAKELSQVGEVLGKHGEAVCRHLIAFSREAASRSRFPVQHFGGILQYLPDAIASLEQTQATRARRLQEARAAKVEDRARKAQLALPAEEKARGRYERRILRLEKVEKRTLSAAAKERIFEEILTQTLAEEGGEPTEQVAR